MTTCREKINYALLPSKGNKTISIKINSEGNVIVRAPKFVIKEKINHLVSAKSEWILEKQKYFKMLKKLYLPKEFKSGESFCFFGRNIRLKINQTKNSDNPLCVLNSGRLNVFLSKPSLGKMGFNIVRKWYEEQTALIVENFINKHSPSLNVKPERIIMANQSKRWGSCSSNGQIRFNWRISMMPPSVIEYIVVHELCHLKAHNHSKKFWDIVKSVLPDYEIRRQWLCANGLGIILTNKK